MSEETKSPKGLNQHVLRVGDYVLWEMDAERFTISHSVTGESGIFRKDEFLPYVSAFFGLHF